MNNERKQEFKSSGVLTLLGLVGFSAAIIAAPWNRSHRDTEVDAALQKAEVVGYQVVQIYREAAKTSALSFSKSGRNPASVAPETTLESLRTTGTMGNDPWGQPFHYRILSAEKNKAMRILVWSSGPNKKADTAELENESKAISSQPIYVGDDIGVVLSMTQN
ncbi:hypothetical protein [Bdellovibrio svalbardensis]|uniref:General secretion pathway protein GspG n=1 Tax=Bdellovibrio svalbardensis TaxID=2972972 RepID=A0ABT6DE26_9BACT|nr:hypothetical protein [Bdellovibrio svalbardensis]MDG0814742.1 hypothetical protein [Bdellovibrio svalbardensis]